jgi:hypothetical protein
MFSRGVIGPLFGASTATAVLRQNDLKDVLAR